MNDFQKELVDVAKSIAESISTLTNIVVKSYGLNEEASQDTTNTALREKELSIREKELECRFQELAIKDNEQTVALENLKRELETLKALHSDKIEEN